MTQQLRCNCEVDNAFGVAGKLELRFPGTSSGQAKAMAMLGEHLVVLAQVRIDRRPEAALAAVLSDGSLDSQFGECGFAMALFGEGYRVVPTDLISTREGKLLVLAEDRSQPVRAPILARYNSDGTLDRTFANAGIAALRLDGLCAGDEPFAVVELHDGGLMVAMTRFDENADSCGVLVRLSANGSLDERFHRQGSFVFALADEPHLWFEGVMQQADGKVVAWGSTLAGGLLVRLGANDQADDQFGERGCARFALPAVYRNPGLELFDVVEDDEGALLVAGATDSTPYGGVLTRLTRDGAADSRFNGGMVRVNTAFPQGSRWLRCFTQADGDIVVAGLTGIPYKGDDTRFLLGRYRADGGLDSRYGEGTGLVASSIAPGADIAACALAWGEKRMLLGGTSGAGVSSTCCVLSYRV